MVGGLDGVKRKRKSMVQGNERKIQLENTEATNSRAGVVTHNFRAQNGVIDGLSRALIGQIENTALSSPGNQYSVKYTLFFTRFP